ncbi:ABC transporter permease [Microbacterium sp. 18062]|uniref:ABC transporter permease n=1 Tax=Microbacterium sp. 18062 TaxID=2681410 RepID=UPI0013580E24|nr:ABC transporter permease [Microbacterium sp. 18062]
MSGGLAVSRKKLPLSLKIGGAMMAFYFVVAVIGLVWTPFDPRLTGQGPTLVPPEETHWFGTDRLGRDIFSQTIYATHLDLGIVLISVATSFVVGSVAGVLSGYFRGYLDVITTRVLEVLQAFPSLLLAIFLAQVAGPGVATIVIVLTISGIPNYVRLARVQMLSLRTAQYADAARLAGVPPFRIAFQHLLPNAIGPLVAYTSINAAWSVLIIASLGFVGVGLPPGMPEWGSIIESGRDAIMSGQWWVLVFPGIAVSGLAATFYLIGDGLSDLFDPRRRGA